MRNIMKKWRIVLACVTMLIMMFSVTAFAADDEKESEIGGKSDVSIISESEQENDQKEDQKEEDQKEEDQKEEDQKEEDQKEEQKEPVYIYKLVILGDKTYTYTGKAFTPKVDVQVYNEANKKVNSIDLIIGSDYKVTYKNNKNAGTATIEVKGLGKYKDKIKLSGKFTIKPASIKNAKITLYKNEYLYNSKAKTPTVTSVKVGKKTLEKKDYTVNYSANVKPGTGKVTVTGKGNYTGKAYTSFTIKPNKASVTLKRSYNRIRVYWGKVKYADGYEIYRSTSKNSGYKKIDTVSAKKDRKYTDKGRIHNKTYYYKVRAYRNVNGKKIYGDFSNIKSITVRVGTPSIKKINKTSSGSLTIHWTRIDGATGYRVYRSTSKNGTYKRIVTLEGNKTLSYRDKGLVCGRTYYYKVKAYRTSDGELYNGSASEIKKCASRPEKVKWSKYITYDGTKVLLEWDETEGAEGYQIYRSTSKNGTYKRIKTIKSGDVTSWKNTGLKKGKVYYYKIRSYCNTDGKTSYGLYSDVYKKDNAGWRYSTFEGKKIKLYYNNDNELVKDVSNLIGKQSSYVIKVNKRKCTVTVYAKDGDNGYIIPVKSFVCSPGYSTPTGTFYTPAKYRWHELMGPCWGQWNTRIVRGILFHSVFYNSYHNNDSLSVSAYNKLGTICSHGCVRLRAGDAKWIYDNCELNTKVIIYNGSVSGPFGKPSAVKLPYWHTWDPTDPNKFAKCDAYGCH